jgi:hypothetical protein
MGSRMAIYRRLSASGILESRIGYNYLALLYWYDHKRSDIPLDSDKVRIL